MQELLLEESGFIWFTTGQTAAPTPTAPTAVVATVKKSLLFFLSELLLFSDINI
jgi:hypothetical protein